jgi:hypothetical protein
VRLRVRCAAKTPDTMTMTRRRRRMVTPSDLDSDLNGSLV